MDMKEDNSIDFIEDDLGCVYIAYRPIPFKEMKKKCPSQQHFEVRLIKIEGEKQGWCPLCKPYFYQEVLLKRGHAVIPKLRTSPDGLFLTLVLTPQEPPDVDLPDNHFECPF